MTNQLIDRKSINHPISVGSAEALIAKSHRGNFQNFIPLNYSMISYQGQNHKLAYFKLPFFCIAQRELSSRYTFLTLENRAQFYRCIPDRFEVGLLVNDELCKKSHSILCVALQDELKDPEFAKTISKIFHSKIFDHLRFPTIASSIEYLTDYFYDLDKICCYQDFSFKSIDECVEYLDHRNFKVSYERVEMENRIGKTTSIRLADGSYKVRVKLSKLLHRHLLSKYFMYEFLLAHTNHLSKSKSLSVIVNCDGVNELYLSIVLSLNYIICKRRFNFSNLHDAIPKILANLLCHPNQTRPEYTLPFL